MATNRQHGFVNATLRHWKGLTAFLRVAGAPLDNICERALKRAVLHRKNALFYKTLNGAQAGDLFMTLIHTCRLCDANSFDYMTELQRHTLRSGWKTVFPEMMVCGVTGHLARLLLDDGESGPRAWLGSGNW
jgi:hypothetical protein